MPKALGICILMQELCAPVRPALKSACVSITNFKNARVDTEQCWGKEKEVGASRIPGHALSRVGFMMCLRRSDKYGAGEEGAPQPRKSGRF